MKTMSNVYPPMKVRLRADIQKERHKPENKIYLGNTDPNGNGENIWIPLVDKSGRPMRITMLIAGPPGCGKTILLKNVETQAYLLKDAITVVSDPKLEQRHTKHLPEGINRLPKNYIPRILKVKSYLPEYCISRFPRSPPKDVEKENVFNYKLSDMEVDDIETLLNITGTQVVQQNLTRSLDEAWDKMKRKLKKEYPNRKVSDLISAVKQLKESREEGGFSHRYTKNKLIGLLNKLLSHEVFGNKNINPLQDLYDGNIPVLSNKYSNRISIDRCYSAIWMRKMYHAIERARIRHIPPLPPLWIFADELQTVATRNTSSATVLTKLILRQGRQYMIHFVGATQSFGDQKSRSEDVIDPSILAYIDYLIVFRIFNPIDLNFLANSRGIDRWDPRRKRLENLEFNKKEKIFQMALINTNGDVTRFYNFSPMTGHVFEGS